MFSQNKQLVYKFQFTSNLCVVPKEVTQKSGQWYYQIVWEGPNQRIISNEMVGVVNANFLLGGLTDQELRDENGVSLIDKNKAHLATEGLGYYKLSLSGEEINAALKNSTSDNLASVDNGSLQQYVITTDEEVLNTSCSGIGSVAFGSKRFDYDRYSNYTSIRVTLEGETYTGEYYFDNINEVYTGKINGVSFINTNKTVTTPIILNNKAVSIECTFDQRVLEQLLVDDIKAILNETTFYPIYNTIVEGNNSIVAGGSVRSYGNFNAVFGVDSVAYQHGGFAVGTSRVGQTEGEFNSFNRNTTNGRGQIIDSEGSVYDESFSFAVAMGYQSQAKGPKSIAIGDNSVATNKNSVAIGLRAQSTGEGAIAIGSDTIASSNYQTVFGHNNKEDNKALFIIGNGEDSTKRNNAFVVTTDGKAQTDTSPTSEKDLTNKKYVDTKTQTKVSHMSKDNKLEFTRYIYATQPRCKFEGGSDEEHRQDNTNTVNGVEYLKNWGMPAIIGNTLPININNNTQIYNYGETEAYSDKDYINMQNPVPNIPLRGPNFELYGQVPQTMLYYMWNIDTWTENPYVD